MGVPAGAPACGVGIVAWVPVGGFWGWGVCPEADTDMPEANMRAPAAATAERTIEARNCWYKRIAIVSREVNREAVRRGIAKTAAY
jgi:hypothetical protein